MNPTEESGAQLSKPGHFLVSRQREFHRIALPPSGGRARDYILSAVNRSHPGISFAPVAPVAAVHQPVGWTP